MHPLPLHRIYLSLALGHLLTLPVVYLYYRFERQSSPAFYGLILFAGLLLTTIALFDIQKKGQKGLPFLCLGILMMEVTYFLFQDLGLPLMLLLPLLSALGSPMLGRRGSYLIGAVSSLIISYYYFTVFENPLERIPSLVMVHIALFFAAYLSEVLWSSIFNKKEALERALFELHKKEEELENWVKRLGRASSLMSEGRVMTRVPQPPPSHVFDELTRGMEKMEEKLGQYFCQILMKDRLSGLGILATGIAHEINTPLTTMKFVLEGDSQLSFTTRRQLTQEIDRLTAIAKRMLSLANPKREDLCDLSRVVKSVPLPSHIRIEFILNEGTWVHCPADQIQHCIQNLIENAIDAVKDVRSPKIKVRSYEPSPGVVCLEVCDNGSGIPPSLLSKVFQPFFTTKAPSRSGLGLFVVHQILKEHEGTVEIESTGEGTTVRMLFPKAEDLRKEARG